MQKKLSSTGFAIVPVTLQVANIDLDAPRYGSPVRVEFAVFNENGDELQFVHNYRFRRWIRVLLDEQTLKRRFFKDVLTDDELKTLLTKFYNNEVSKRKFKLHPWYESQGNLRYWYVYIQATRELPGLGVDENRHKGIIDWTELYPKETEERQKIHLLMNRVGRERQKERRANAGYNRMKSSRGRPQYGLGGL